jgi:Predicted permeases
MEENNENLKVEEVEKLKKKWYKKGWVWFLVAVVLIVLINILVGVFFGWDKAEIPWNFLSDQVLGMKWLNSLIGMAVTGIGGTFEETSWQFRLESSIQFFIYDFIKIGILLCSLIFIVSYLQSYFPPERTKKILGNFHGIGANIIGALLGTVTPFCSCSSIPIFIGFTRAGLSSGVTFSFLISSPLVDLGSLMLLVGFFGWPIAIAYVVVGLIIAVVGGTIIEATGIGNQVKDFVKAGPSAIDIDSPKLTHKDRLIYARDQMWETYKKVFWYVIVGIALGAIIHNVIPADWVESILGGNNWYGVLVATFIGVPMYADIFGTLPVAEALYTKGAGLGTILAFMMSVTALSLPSLIMLSKAVKRKLLAVFIGVVVLGIIIIGYLFNAFGYLFI